MTAGISKNTMLVRYASFIAAVCFLVPNVHSALQGDEVNVSASAAGLVAALLFLRSHRRGT